MFNMVVQDFNDTYTFYDEPMLRSSIKELVVHTADGESVYYWLHDVKAIIPTTLSRAEWQQQHYMRRHNE